MSDYDDSESNASYDSEADVDYDIDSDGSHDSNSDASHDSESGTFYAYNHYGAFFFLEKIGKVQYA